MKLSIIIPVYNEKNTIEEIIRRVRATDYEKEIIIVDDFSIEGTREILNTLKEEADIRIFHHPKNMGKGAKKPVFLKWGEHRDLP